MSGAMDRLVFISQTRTATVASGMLGAALGLAMGLAGGLAARRSPGAGLAVAVAGLVLGGLAGAGLARVTVPLYLANVDRDAESFFPPLLTHGATWVGIGAVAGLAFG